MNELVISTYIQILQEVMIEHDKQEAAGSFLLESISTQESANVVTDLSSKKLVVWCTGKILFQTT